MTPMRTQNATSPAGDVEAPVAHEALLRADGITSGYDGIPAIRNLSLSVKAGEVVALLGANGAGKTTTLLTLAGEVPLHSGHVTWLGQPARGPLHRRARSGLCMLTEERSLFMGLTVRQNLRLGRGPSDKALEIMPELVGLMNRRAGLLSAVSSRCSPWPARSPATSSCS